MMFVLGSLPNHTRIERSHLIKEKNQMTPAYIMVRGGPMQVLPMKKREKKEKGNSCS